LDIVEGERGAGQVKTSCLGGAVISSLKRELGAHSKGGNGKNMSVGMLVVDFLARKGLRREEETKKETQRHHKKPRRCVLGRRKERKDRKKNNNEKTN